MTQSLKDLSQAQDVESQAEEKVQGSGGYTTESGIHDAKIAEAYLRYPNDEDSKTVGLALNLALRNGKFANVTFWLKNKETGETWKINDKGKKVNMWGFQRANTLARLITGKDLSDLTEDERYTKDFSKGAKPGATRAVQAILELLDQKVKVALVLERVNQQDKDWNDIPGDRLVNVVDAFLDYETSKTYTEKKENSPAAYAKEFLEKYEGEIRDNRSITDSTPPASSSAPEPAPVAETEPLGEKASDTDKTSSW